MRSVLMLLALVSLAMAGCTDDEHPSHIVTCDDGSTQDISDLDHHNQSFDPAVACTPAELTLVVSGVPSQLGAYETAAISWSMDLGERDHGHSMLTELRVASSSQSVSSEDGPDAYGAEYQKREHQDLPFSYDATLIFEEPGDYFLRGYAVVDGEHHWSQEFPITVTPVAPTGTTVTLVHSVGESLGTFTADTTNLTLGDAIVFQNDDLVEHVFTFDSGARAGETVTVPAQSSSEAILMEAPGTYEISTDDQQSKKLTLSVSA